MIETLIALLAALGLSCLLRAPDLHGLGVFYDPCLRHVSSEDQALCRKQPQDLMRNGEPFQLGAATVAVDAGYWPAWANREAIVSTECGGLFRVRVTDTGMLKAAKRFRYGVHEICASECTRTLRYWPAGTGGVKWEGDVTYPVVADFPMGFFAEHVTCEPDTMATTIVAVWILGDD